VACLVGVNRSSSGVSVPGGGAGVRWIPVGRRRIR
jgi:hypothetical protein